MFGKEHSIRDVLPHYHLDYQERPEAKTEARWIDRITLDGSWPGNLFEFYRRVYGKLVADVKVPFALKDDQRTDDTQVHEALREALVNSLIHADYTGRVSVLVVKRPDLFGFRNPGTMRIPLERALGGGESDCRNRRLQRMFSLIGRGEQAGSGIPKILAGWRSQHWRKPTYTEVVEPEQTQLALRMVSLLPVDSVSRLELAFGDRFRQLDEVGKLALCTADLEGKVTHPRLMEITDEHPHDVSQTLRKLCFDGMLDSSGVRRAKVYFLPGQPPVASGDTFDALLGQWQTQVGQASDTSSGHKDLGSGHKHSGSAPPSDPIAHLRDHLEQMAEQAADRCSNQQRSKPDEIRAAILLLCAQEYRTAAWLATRLNRDQESLTKHHLRKMVRENLLAHRNPANPTDPEQAYITTSDGGLGMIREWIGSRS